MKINEFNLPRIKVRKLKEIELFPHQKELFDNFNKQKSFTLITPTGSGKTMAALLPILHYNKNALFIYPTNALMDNQAESILKICKKLNKTYHFVDGSNFQGKIDSGIDFSIIKIDGDFLEKVKEKMKYRTKGEALYYLIRLSLKPIIVLTNPDIFYLIMSIRYSKSAEIVALLRKIDTIVFDELHLYSGLELVNILTVIFLSEKLRIGESKILLSATPDNIILGLLKSLISPQTIEIKENAEEHENLYTVVHEVNISGTEVDRDNKLEKIVQVIFQIRQPLKENRETNNEPEYIPLVVILNSVVEIIKLEEELLKNGFQQEEITPIRGLMDKSERKITDKTLVVLGTSAIEIGIDFRCDYLIFEASDAASFLQRFGRVGRHRKGKATLLGNYREIDTVNKNKQVSREEFVASINDIYAIRNTFSWFPKSKMGLFAAYTTFKKYLDTLSKDHNLSDDKKKELKNTFDKWFKEYGEIISNDASQKCKNLLYVKNLLKRPNYHKWPKIFYAKSSFRSSLQSVEIYVNSEKQKGRIPLIKADALSIFKYGNNIKWNKKKGRLEIDNFNGKHKVSVNIENIDYNDYGEILCNRNGNFKDLKMKQDDHFTALSYILNMDEEIFIFLPKEIKNLLPFDWRFQPLWCDDQRSIMIIGGMALIAKELYSEKAHNLGTPDGTILI